MANKEYYLDAANGDDGYDGTSWATAKQTIQGILDLMKTDNDTGGFHRIFMGPGVYTPTYLDLNSYITYNVMKGTAFIGVGDVIIDGEETVTTWLRIDDNFQVYNAPGSLFIGIKFRDFLSMAMDCQHGSMTQFVNCAFYATGASDTIAMVCGGAWSGKDIRYVNCLFYRVLITNNASNADFINCVHHGFGGSQTYGSIPYADQVCVGNACPGDNVFNANGGINSTTVAPPFTNTGAFDLSYDPLHANYSAYMTGGWRGGRVGATFKPSVVFYATDMMSGTAINTGRTKFTDHHSGAWGNDVSYYDPAFPSTSVTTGANDKIDFDEGSGELTAAVAQATYTDGDTLATAIQTALNNAGVANFSCTFSANTKKFTITSDGSELSLLWNTGTNTAISIGSDIGFDTSADDTAYLTYQGDNAVTEGPQGAAPSDAAPATFDQYGKVIINSVVENAGKSARGISDVIDVNGAYELLSVMWSAQEEVRATSASVVDNSAATTARQIEYRGNDDPFDKDDAAGTTDVDWTLVDRDDNSLMTRRYIQLRAIVRIDGAV